MAIASLSMANGTEDSVYASDRFDVAIESYDGTESFTTGTNAIRQGNFSLALLHLGPLAAQGNDGAQANVGQMYANGWGLNRDLLAAQFWFLLAYEGGSENAARAYNSARSKSRSKLSPEAQRIALSVALDRYHEYAERGYANAQFTLGRVYKTGLLGVEKNIATAENWLRRAAANNYPAAALGLGILYSGGSASKEDLDEAIRFTELALRLGDPNAAEKLIELRCRRVGPKVFTRNKLLEAHSMLAHAGSQSYICRSKMTVLMESWMIQKTFYDKADGYWSAEDFQWCESIGIPLARAAKDNAEFISNHGCR